MTAGKYVEIVLPKDPAFFNFVYGYEFINFLRDNNVSCPGGGLDKYKASYAPIKSPMFPLKFHDDQQFQDLLNDLNNPGRLDLVLSEIKESDIVRSNVIHSIILKEIGDNIYIHSGDASANIIMTKHSRLRREDFEFDFSERLARVEVINIVLSDYGSGIFHTLHPAYTRDPILPPEDKLEEPTESDIVRYAFFKHTTSRSAEQRKETLQRYITSNSLRYAIPTGLYKVKNIVKRYRGIIYVRTGRSIVCFDYFSKAGEEQIYTNIDERKLRDLAPFPGVQMRFYFPLKPIPADKENFFTSDSRDLPSPKTCKLLDYVAVNNYIVNPINEYDLNHIGQLQLLLDQIESLKLKHEGQTGGILVDAADFANVGSKNIQHLLVATLMAAQSDNLAFILVNISKESILELDNDYSSDPNFRELPPLLAYDNIFVPRIIGLASSSFNELSTYYAEKASPEIQAEYALRSQHFCRPYKNILRLRYDKADVLVYFCSRLSRSISRKLTDPTFKIYFPNQRVLIPNKYYCDGFFELINLYDSRVLFQEVCTWIGINLQIERPDCILSIGYNAKNIIDAIYASFTSQSITINAKHFYIDPSNIYLSSLRVQEQIQKDDSVVIVTDVIGSAKILSMAIEQATRGEIKKVLTLINAAPSNPLFSQKIQVPVVSIVERHVEYHPSMPKNWDYSAIKIFDLKSNRLRENSSLPQGPLWRELDKRTIRHEDEEISISINPFLEDLSYISNSYFCGHFESRNRHLVYLFNIGAIITHFAKPIGEIITAYVRDAESKFLATSQSQPVKTAFCCLLYPTFNPGLDKVAQTVAKEFAGLLAMPIDVSDLQAGLPGKYDLSDRAVILIDDAFITGATIERMIDIAAERGAAQIFCFALIKRGNSYEGRKFENVRQYGNSTVHSRYLIDAEIPIFDKATCPLCKKVRDWDRVLQQLRNNDNLDELRRFAERTRNHYCTKPVSAVFSEKRLSSPEPNHSDAEARYGLPAGAATPGRPHFSKLNIRWKLQVALGDVSMRKSIIEILRRLPDYREAALMVITILSEEKHFFITDQTNRDLLFYNKAKLVMIDACKWFLDRHEDLDALQLLSVLDILLVLDEAYVIETSPELLVRCADNDSLFFAILATLLLSTVSWQNPSRIVRALNVAAATLPLAPRRNTLVHLSLHFERRHTEMSAGQDAAVHVYKEIMVKLHDISHQVRTIEHYLHPDYYDQDEFLRNYRHFKEDMDEFRSRLGIFSTSLSLQLGALCQKIDDISGKVGIALEEIDASVFTGCIRPNAGGYEALISRIWTLLGERCNEDSLARALESLQVDVKRICYEVLQQERRHLDAEGIAHDFSLPEDATSVFGDERSVIHIFKNLIENVHRHSKGSNFVIFGVKSDRGDKLTIMFLDDGAVNGEIVLKAGLWSVQKSVHVCGGSLTISRAADCQHAPLIQKAFPALAEGTVAEVTFSLINI